MSKSCGGAYRNCNPRKWFFLSFVVVDTNSFQQTGRGIREARSHIFLLLSNAGIRPDQETLIGVATARKLLAQGVSSSHARVKELRSRQPQGRGCDRGCQVSWNGKDLRFVHYSHPMLLLAEEKTEPESARLEYWVGNL
jgi:hypothetical protein